jgi:hypothetical protein
MPLPVFGIGSGDDWFFGYVEESLKDDVRLHFGRPIRSNGIGGSPLARRFFWAMLTAAAIFESLEHEIVLPRPVPVAVLFRPGVSVFVVWVFAMLTSVTVDVDEEVDRLWRLERRRRSRTCKLAYKMARDEKIP